MQFNSVFSNNNIFNSSSFKTSEFKLTNKKVNFSKAMKSVNFESLYFTNYLAKKSPLIKFVRKQYCCIINGTLSINDENKFKPSFVNLDNEYLKLKLLSVIQKTRGISHYKLPPAIYKYKCLENKEFQLYIANNDDEYEMLVIDTYHLMIPAPDKDKNEKKEHSKEKYNLHKLDDYDLSEII